MESVRRTHPRGMDEAVAASAARPGLRAPTRLEVDEVYARHGDYVFRVLRRLGVAEAQVEDAVQDVFMVVLRRASGFEGRSTVRTWVFGIALRVARAYRRKASRSPVELATEELRGQGPSPMEQVERAEEVARLMRLLDLLSEEQREVFVLCEIEGLTAPEVAEAIEVNVNTVYSRLRLARERFSAGYRREQARETGPRGSQP